MKEIILFIGVNPSSFEIERTWARLIAKGYKETKVNGVAGYLSPDQTEFIRTQWTYTF